MTTQADFASLLQKSQQLNLKYKTRIIELENQLNHQKIKARQYETKFQDAVLQSQFSEGQDLIEKLNSKEKQLNDCRKQIIDLNRRLANTGSSPTQTDLLALARENQQLMANIEEIKNAAISAIMLKQQQIEQLNKSVSKYDIIEAQLKFQTEKYESLERQFEVAINEKEEDIKQLSEKLTRQRQTFLSKLQSIQSEASQSQHFRERLLEKTNDLEGTIEKDQMLLTEYEDKIVELESQLAQTKLSYDKEKTLLEIQLGGYKDDIKLFQRDEKNFTKAIEQLKNRQKQAKENIARLTEANEQLKYKLSIKKKRQNKDARDRITSSFAGVQRNNPVYASFAFRPREIIAEDLYQREPQKLGDFPQIEEIDGFIENFSMEQFRKGSEDQPPRPEPAKEPTFQKLMAKKKPQPVAEQSTTKPNSPVESATATNNQPPQPKHDFSKELDASKQTIFRLETEKKELQDTINSAYNQLDSLNQTITNLTADLQQQRKNIAQLRQQMKRTKKESELIVEAQSLTLHVEKLENDMVASKLKFAEQVEFQREKYNREKVVWTQKLIALTDQIAKQDLLIQQQAIKGKSDQKKKKKGFFS